MAQKKHIEPLNSEDALLLDSMAARAEKKDQCVSISATTARRMAETIRELGRVQRQHSDYAQRYS